MYGTENSVYGTGTGLTKKRRYSETGGERSHNIYIYITNITDKKPIWGFRMGSGIGGGGGRR